MRRNGGDLPNRRKRSYATATIWASVAAVSVVAALSAAMSDRGRERIAVLFDPAPELARAEQREGTPDLDHIAGQIARMQSELRLIALENEAMATKIARIEMPASAPITTASVPRTAEEQAVPGVVPREEYPPIPSHGDSVDLAFDDLPLSAAADNPHDEMTADSAMAQIAVLASPEAREAPIATGSTHFALEIGSGATISELSGLWGILLERHSGVLSGLSPRFDTVRGDSGASRLLLRAGPINNIAAAMDACSELRNRGAACSTAPYHGRTLVMQ